MSKLEVYLNKPISVSFSTLDISKTFLYEFYYNYIKSQFGSSAKLLYTETDSLIYEFWLPDIYFYIKRDNERFDTSYYDQNNINNIPQINKKVPGFMKDENNGNIMLKFVGLRAKMYAYKVDKRVVKKSKGSTFASIKKLIFEDCKDSLISNQILKEQRLITSKKHNVFTIKQNKIVLSSANDKKILNSSTTDTRPWGYKITN